MRESQRDPEIDKVESLLRAAAPSPADEASLERVRAQALKAAVHASRPGSRAVAGSRRSWVAAGLAAAVLVVVASGYLATSVGPAGTPGAGPGRSSTAPRSRVGEALYGLPAVSLDAALQGSSAAIHLPAGSILGGVSKAALLTDESAPYGNRAKAATRADIGVAVAYASRTLLVALPVKPGSAAHTGFLSNGATNGVESGTSVVVIHGRDVAVVPGAVRVETDGRKVALGTALTWTEQGIRYTLASDTLSLSQLEGVARSIE